ncbi:MAG: D,D-dipeptide ABC transporter permease [Chloroflexi bacterium]|nr:MAG: D,D-dipeptide ABC transporter permease [Chloroflexota bacterium]
MSIDETHAKPSTVARTAPAENALAAAAHRRNQLEDVTWRTRLRAFNRRFFRGQPLNVLGVVIVLGFLVLVAIGQPLAEARGSLYAPNTPNIQDKLLGPSSKHWFGTDDLGRDIFSRVISGAKYSLGVAVVILAIAVTLGTVLGAIAGYFGGMVDELLMRLTDMFLAFPALILAIAISATLGPNLRNAVIALSTVFWPWYARLVRGQVLAIKSRDFIEAARSVGVPGGRLLYRHIMPSAISVIVIQMTLDVGYAILATSSLSFIGLGAQPPTPEWGAMISSARAYFREAWWYITFPGLALTITVLGFNLLGDGLRDYFDPRSASK